MLRVLRASNLQRFAALLALLTPAPAAYAAAIPFTAQLAITIAQLGPIVWNGSGTATVNGSGGGVHISSLQLPAGAIQTTAAPLPVTDPSAYPVVGIQITAANAVGNFSGSGGIMPLPGVAKVCLFGSLGCAGAVTNLSIPLSVVGQPAAGFVAGVVDLTVVGAAWTTQTAAFGTFLSAMGFRHGPASATSSTAAPSGQLQLVTPINISTNLAASNVIPSLAVLTLHFVPEPGTLLLIGGGLSLLAAIGGRRLKGRAPLRGLVIVLAVVATAPAAHAAAIPFTAQLALKIVTLDPVVVNGGGIATVNGSGGGVHIASLQLPAAAVQTAGYVVPVSDPQVFPITGVQLTAANGIGNFSGSGGIMPLPGVAKVCLFGSIGCANPVSNLSVPLTVVGQPGAAAFSTGAVNLTVVGAAWTTQTVAFGTSISAMGFRHGPASATSSTAAPSGQLQLVTPINISTNIGSSSVIPALAVLTLHFVPEPGTMLLIGGGLSLLAAIGRRRVRAQQRR